jgi:potassium-dependent mechanosensitive channel
MVLSARETGQRALTLERSFGRFASAVEPRKQVAHLVVFRFLVIALPFALGLQLVRSAPGQDEAAHSISQDGGGTTTDRAPSAVSSAQRPDQAIPLANIADRAEELDLLVSEVSSDTPSRSELVAADQKSEVQAQELEYRLRQTRQLLAGSPTPLELEDEQRYWRSRAQEYEEQRRILTSRAARLEQEIALLELQQPVWLATWYQVRETRGLETVLDRIEQQLSKIDVARSKARAQLNALLTLQNKVSQQDQQISQLRAQVREARNREGIRIFQPNAQPLWRVNALREIGRATVAFPQAFDRSLGEAREFLGSQKPQIIAFGIVYLLLSAAALKLRHYVAGRAWPNAPPSLRVVQAPFAVALLVTLVATGGSVARAPSSVVIIFYFLYAVPILRLLVPLTSPKLRTLLYFISTFYGLGALCMLVQLPQVFTRGANALLSFTALVGFGWLARPSRLRALQSANRHLRMLTVAIQTNLVLLMASFVANILGFVALAEILLIAALVGPFLFAALYCAARVFNLLLAISLQAASLRSLLETHVDAVQLWGRRVLAAGASLLWARAMLQLLTVYDDVRSTVFKLLEYPIGAGRVHFTIGAVLGIASVFLGGYALANALILLLTRMLLPRLHLQRGLPYAISTITYYVLLLLVAVAGLSAVGVELNKFTVLTGALGVGLGFGLQNIVNNFVSGVILLFERPIQLGDTVEVGGLVGTVRRIGARSSTVLTFEGAEVIVPNSNLLSNQVINWTLSSQWRRIDIPVRVAYGTDPEQTIRLLTGVAESHPEVLRERPPAAFFMGFGENALNFELRFWCARQDMWFQLQSDVTVAVAKALRDAGFEIPVPQRDLRFRGIAEAVAETLANSTMQGVSSADAGNRTGRT